MIDINQDGILGTLNRNEKEFVWEIQLQVEFTIYRKLAIIKTKTTTTTTKRKRHSEESLLLVFFNLHDTIKPNTNYKQLPITSAPNTYIHHNYNYNSISCHLQLKIKVMIAA